MVRAAAQDDTGGDMPRTSSRRGWRLILRVTRERKVGIGFGVAVGLCGRPPRSAPASSSATPIDQGIDRRRPERPAPLVDRARRRGRRARRRSPACAATSPSARPGGSRPSLRDRLFAHLQRLHFAFHDQAQTGQLMSRANTDLQQIQAFVVMIPLTISNAVTVLAVTVILLVIDPVLTLLALGLAAVPQRARPRFSRRLHPDVMGIQRESAELAAVVEETVAGVRVVKGFGAERVQAGAARAEADDVYDESMAAARVRARYLPGARAAAQHRAHRRARLRRPPGAQRRPHPRLARRVQRLHRHARSGRCGCSGMIVAQAQRAAAVGQRVDEVLVDRARRSTTPPTRCRCPAVRPAARSRFEGVRFGYGRADAGARRLRPAHRRRASRWRSSAPPARQDDRRPPASRGSTTSTRARSASTASTSATCACASCGGRSASCSRTRSCSATRSPPTSPSPTPTPRRAEIERAARLAGAHDFIVDLPEGYGTAIGERGLLAVGRAAPAHRHRPGDPGRPPRADPRRRHLGRSTRPRSTRSATRSPRSCAAARRSSSPTGRPRSPWPTGSCCSTGGRVVAEGTHARPARRPSAPLPRRCWPPPTAQPRPRAVPTDRRRRPVGHGRCVR